jgi:hypothetical protein
MLLIGPSDPRIYFPLICPHLPSSAAADTAAPLQRRPAIQIDFREAFSATLPSNRPHKPHADSCRGLIPGLRRDDGDRVLQAQRQPDRAQRRTVCCTKIVHRKFLFIEQRALSVGLPQVSDGEFIRPIMMPARVLLPRYSADQMRHKPAGVGSDQPIRLPNSHPSRLNGLSLCLVFSARSSFLTGGTLTPLV